MPQFPKLYQISARYPKWVLGLSLFLALVSLWFSQKLHIESDFSSLLPTQTESIKNIREMKKYFGNSGFLYVTVEGPQAAEAESFAQSLAKEIAKFPEVSFVDSEQPVDFFKERLWLYADLADLQEMENRTQKGLELEAQGVNPLMGNWLRFADQEDLPDLTFSDIVKKYEKRSGVHFQDKKQNSDEKPFRILRVKLQKTKNLQETMQSLLKTIRSGEQHLKSSAAYQDIQINFTGEYQTSLEQAKYMEKEIQKSTLFVLILLVLLLVFYFRDLKSLFLVAVPLLVGILWTGGLVYFILGHLNVITAFAGAILGGLGSDYGIYLLTRYYHERAQGNSFAKSLDLSFSNEGTAKATYASVLCMVAVFVALGFSSFGVFVEFAIVGAVGLVANYIAMISILPAWLSLRPATPVPVKKKANPRSGKISLLLYPYAPKLVLLAVILISVISATTLKKQSQIYFEDGNMENRSLPATQLYNKVSEKMQASLSPTLLMVKGKENEKKLVEALKEYQKNTAPENLVYNDAVGLSTFLPENQEAKKEILRRIIPQYENLNLFWNKKKEKFLESVKQSIASPEIKHEDLPQEIKRLFESPQDKDVFVVYLFPAFGRGSLENMTRYTEGVFALKEKLGLEFVAVDGTFIEHDIVQLIRKEAPRGLALILISLTAILLWSIRPFSRALAISGCLVISLLILSGILSLMKVPLNILNIGVFPVILGTGVNCFIHFAHRFDELGDMKLTIQSYMGAILTCDITTIIGFLGLLLTPSEGLRSVGWVAVIGLALVTLVCVVVFPRLLRFPALKSKEHRLVINR